MWRFSSRSESIPWFSRILLLGGITWPSSVLSVEYGDSTSVLFVLVVSNARGLLLSIYLLCTSRSTERLLLLWWVLVKSDGGLQTKKQSSLKSRVFGRSRNGLSPNDLGFHGDFRMSSTHHILERKVVAEGEFAVFQTYRSPPTKA